MVKAELRKTRTHREDKNRRSITNPRELESLASAVCCAPRDADPETVVRRVRVIHIQIVN